VCRNFGRKIDGWLASWLRMTTNGIYAAEAVHCDLSPAYVNNPASNQTKTSSVPELPKDHDRKDASELLQVPQTRSTLLETNKLHH
jgi:hypothetical protein